MSHTFNVLLEGPAANVPVLVQSAGRYQTFIRNGARRQQQSTAGAPVLSAVKVTVATPTATTLSFETNYSYTVDVDVVVDADAGASAASGTATATITARTVFGAMYGLETLAQLCASGRVASVRIDDKPQYRYRGLMIDTGRRFVPKADVLNSLEVRFITQKILFVFFFHRESAREQ